MGYESNKITQIEFFLRIWGGLLWGYPHMKSHENYSKLQLRYGPQTESQLKYDFHIFSCKNFLIEDVQNF